ncbi:hypothetical protein CRG98_017112 [Punica granatum]|uniref:O-fucosyltransferase family protein n=1 Tax=Punica granatum TaxID=22663 RepID=A0A2I0K1Q9_PUNGR|nr:hypothetical protein CRG98_017112 [Punica granatum]
MTRLAWARLFVAGAAAAVTMWVCAMSIGTWGETASNPRVVNWSSSISTSPLPATRGSGIRIHSSSQPKVAATALTLHEYERHGFLMVSANEGLNQMRAGISNMVVIARYLNATLIIPQRDNSSFGHDNRMQKYKVLHFQKTDTRLANNGRPESVQKLRCQVNYGALRFAAPIDELWKKIVGFLRQKGPFLALHLRYEMFMLAFC